MSNTQIWGLHMPQTDTMDPIKKKFVAIGWKRLGDLARLQNTRNEFKNHCAKAYVDAKPKTIASWAGVLYRFVHEISVNDIIIYPSKSDRMINIGRVKSTYKYCQEETPYPNRRQVDWIKHLPRINFSKSALYEIGSAITLFQITTHAEEFRAALKDSEALVPEDENLDEVFPQMEESTKDFVIKRLTSKLNSEEFEEFVAHLLTCMGYYAHVTQKSSDGGFDIIAHKDKLGLEPPIIKVECKQSPNKKFGRPNLQRLAGAIADGEHGLFVTLGKFGPHARSLERERPNLRLIDCDSLINLIYDHYENFNTHYKTLLPLKRAYFPDSSSVSGTQ